MFKSWIDNSSKKLWFQQEVSESWTVNPNIAPTSQEKRKNVYQIRKLKFTYQFKKLPTKYKYRIQQII